MKHLPLNVCCVILSAGLIGCGRNSPSPAVGIPAAVSTPKQNSKTAIVPETMRFTDVTINSGIDWTYQNGREARNNAILESLGGGAALVDYDLDGTLDVFATGGGGFRQKEILGLPSGLFRNLGGWKFSNVSLMAGQGLHADHYTHGAFCGDYGNDGFPDVLVSGYGGLQLWCNQGDGTFEERHQFAGLHDELWSSACGWGDINGDGLLDLYVGHYVNWSFANHPTCTGPRADILDICPPKVFDALPHLLFANNGDGTFRDISAEAGLRKDGKCLGVVLGDLDLDGDIDIYVANDTTDNFLYVNDGHGHFEETGALSGVATDDRGTPNGSMGVDIGDYNLDGRPDIWVANYEVESFALYRNDGNGQYLHVSQATGVTALNGLFVGFGTGFADLDRDGDEDLVVANGHVINHPRRAPLLQVPLLLVNDSGRFFHRVDLPKDSYFSRPNSGRGLALGDLDNDGHLDLLFSNNHAPIALLRNDSKDLGSSLVVRLIGRTSNRDATGAVVVLELTTGERIRLAKGGGSYMSHNDSRLYWGIPQKTSMIRLRVTWPSGSTQHLPIQPESQEFTLIEP